LEKIIDMDVPIEIFSASAVTGNPIFKGRVMKNRLSGRPDKVPGETPPA
jgi:hypothetical protein